MVSRKRRQNSQIKFERVEGRTHLSVARDSAGWTVVTPASDTRVIYASSSQGSDANTGLSPTSPVKTLAKGQSLVRDGSADWLLLKRGDSFESFGSWTKHGRSASQPMYIAAYGTGARPQINSGTSNGFTTAAYSMRRIDNLILSSVSFFASTYNGTNGAPYGILLQCPGSNITIEDVKVQGYKDNITVSDATHAVTDSTIRRCEILDSYNNSNPASVHAQGIYVSSTTKNLTIEENVLDHNGWRQGTPADRTYYNHNIYVYNGAQNVIVRNNIIADASFYGLKFNAGGTASGNLFVRNAESVYLESAATISDNVITEAVDAPTQSWGVGINTQKAPSATIDHNLITKIASNGAAHLMGIQLYNNQTPFTGDVQDNVVYNWRGSGIEAATPGNGAHSVTIRNNQLWVTGTNGLSQSSPSPQSTFVYGGNTYYAASQSGANKIGSSRKTLAQWIAATGESDAKYVANVYPDPTRDIEKFSTTVGGKGTFEDFIAIARNMDKSSWNGLYTAPVVNAWMWQGFGQTIATPVVVGSTNPSLFGKNPVGSGDLTLLI
jgi:parallel beta helix pectate lyase-like protein